MYSFRGRVGFSLPCASISSAARAKRCLASGIAIFSSSRSRSISTWPSRAFSRSFSRASPLSDLLIRAASPAARNASRHWLSVAKLIRRLCETVSRFYPHNSRSTASIFCLRDVRPLRPSNLSMSLAQRRSAAPSSSILISHHTPPERTASAYDVSRSTVRRGRGETVQPKLGVSQHNSVRMPPRDSARARLFGTAYISILCVSPE